MTANQHQVNLSVLSLKELKALERAIDQEMDRRLKNKRLSQAQMSMLEEINRRVSGELRLQNSNRTLASLIRRGLVSERWQPPAFGNDYGGCLVYTLTEAGREKLL